MRDSATRPPWAPFLMFTGLLLLVGNQAHAQPGGTINPLWDHYRVYQVTGGPTAAPVVTLEDQFGISNHDPFELHHFSNPDQKTHDGVVHAINDPRLHYTWWFLGRDPTFSRPGIQVDNQFGPQVLNVRGDDLYLLNPATKDETGPIPLANHYKCYRCDGSPPNATVMLADQWTQRTALVGDPWWLCNPTRKTVLGGPTYDIVDPDQHYVCYDIGQVNYAAPFTPAVSDQFIQDEQLTIFSQRFLCVPSTKFDPTPTKQSTWGRVKILYR